MGDTRRLVFACAVGLASGACATSGDPDRPGGPTSLGMPGTTGDDGVGSSETGVDGDVGGATGSDAGGPCTPGMQIACACPAAIQGVQACKDDGSGYLPCECLGDDAPGDGSGAESEGAGDDATETGSADCDRGDCSACQQCAFSGACAAETMACLTESGCLELNQCLGECMDEACQHTCLEATPSRALAVYDALVKCVGEACPMACGAP